ncbi:uncharacterized protein LOC111628830 [Centruroides sculpturatus]|uniref:uncharacterized protein LOC111628830 n=1 Tax=Centruroides sculpturatus TaxID=218467 RepID=UPI000C6CB696|nr:uncharacterized protein LOC111628830 [Centruroides sculpturatus]
MKNSWLQILAIVILACNTCRSSTSAQQSTLDNYQQFLNGYQNLYGNNFHVLSPYRYQTSPAYRPGITTRIRNLMNALFFRRDKKKFYPNHYLFNGFKMENIANSKPLFMSESSYKPQVIPYRQLQKYFKPYQGGNTRYVLPQSVYGAPSYSAVKGQPIRTSYKVSSYQKTPQKQNYSKTGFRPVSTNYKTTISSS